jgi:hypothetical protein
VYVDSSAERSTTAPRSLGSDLKLYLSNNTATSVRVSMHVSMGLTRMVNVHLICDIPSVWEHTGAWVILGENIDGLLNTLESEQG